MRCFVSLCVILLAGCNCGRSLSVDGGALAAEDAGIDAGSTPGCRATVIPDAGRLTFEFPAQPCTFTLAQAAAGVEFRYTVVVAPSDAQFLESYASPEQNCSQPKPGIGVHVLEKVVGDGGSYCVCDEGRCAPPGIATGATPGRHPLTFSWRGRSWTGPSDFGNPEGPPLPPGEYAFTLESSIGDARTDQTPQPVRGSFFFTLTP